MKRAQLRRQGLNRPLIELETHHPAMLSWQLRETANPFLRERRGIIGLSLLATAALSLIGLYQMGILRRLPEPRLPHCDAEEVNRSTEAYRWLETPDAFLGLGSYVATMTLAAMGVRTAPRSGPGFRWHWRRRWALTRCWQAFRC